MIVARHDRPLPGPDLHNLETLPPELPLLAFLALTGHGSVRRDGVEAALARLYGDVPQFESALAACTRSGFMSQTRGGRCRITDAGRVEAEARLGKLLGRSWSDIAARGLAGIALGIDVKGAKARAYLARKDNLESAALGRLYGITPAGAMPARAALRYALLRAFITARIPECEPAFTEIAMHNTSRDVIGRAVMLGAAGLRHGTVRDAEAALLQKALSLKSDAKDELVEALIRASLGRNAPRLPERIRVEVESKKQDLTEFATTVRDLAKTLKTAPFAGRVAIAQVYDAGVARGLDFGTLDAFKSKVASACRAGLLDLERYDIAGPMDSALRERSRTAFGRDERHFIVNEWI